jgi:hypothetical protein
MSIFPVITILSLLCALDSGTDKYKVVKRRNICTNHDECLYIILLRKALLQDFGKTGRVTIPVI